MSQPFCLADLYRLRTPSQPAVSPDGRRVAFILQGFRKKENDRYQNLWLAGTDGREAPHRLTRGFTKDSAPAWSPDGRLLAFLSTREHELEVAAALAEQEGPAGGSGRDGAPSGQGSDSGAGLDEPKPQIWVFDMEQGGEPRQLTWREEGVSQFDWSPDGTRIVFASRDPTPAQRDYLKSIRGKQAGGQGKGADEARGPLVIGRVQHKHDAHGYLDEVRTHLFVVDVANREARRLTQGPCDETDPRWSPDGRWIVFVSNRTGDPDNNRRTDLWLVSPDGKEARRLTRGDVDARLPRWSPDGRHVAFVAAAREPENGYVLRHLMCVSAADALPVANLESCVGEGWSSIGGIVPDAVAGDPVPSARVYPVATSRTPVRTLTGDLDRTVLGDPVWLDRERLVVLVADRGQTRLALTSLDGGPTFAFPVADRGCTLHGAHASGETVVVLLDRPGSGPDLFAVAPSDLGRQGAEDRAVRLTAVNAAVFAGRTPARYERIEFNNSDGDAVEALVALPPGFDPARGRAPLIVHPHGGPMWHDTPAFQFDEQYWAGQGYLVLLVNYRGSIGYGEAFCRVIQGRWGPLEHDDLMSGVQAVIDRGWADPDRLFCTGFSQGGIMTNWAVGHSHVFRAAVTEHGMWDYVAAFGTDDCHLWWQDDLGVPWQNEAGYRAISPMAGVTGIRTPLLITAGEVDWRCPLSQAEQLYLALKKRGVPTKLVIYQGERHAVDRPRRAVDRLRRICRWFAEYGGQPFSDASAEGYPPD